MDAESVAGHVGRYERRLTLSHRGDELVLGTVYAPLHFRALPELEATYLCTDPFFVGVPLQLATDDQGRATLSIGFGLDDTGAIVDPIVAARIGSGSPPRPGHRRELRARLARRSVGFSRLPNAQRLRSRDPLGATGGSSGRGSK